MIDLKDLDLVKARLAPIKTTSRDSYLVKFIAHNMTIEVERLQGIVDRVQALRDEMGEGKAFTILAMGKEADYPISYFLEYLDTALETE